MLPVHKSSSSKRDASKFEDVSPLLALDAFGELNEPLELMAYTFAVQRQKEIQQLEGKSLWKFSWVEVEAQRGFKTRHDICIMKSSKRGRRVRITLGSSLFAFYSLSK